MGLPVGGTGSAASAKAGVSVEGELKRETARRLQEARSWRIPGGHARQHEQRYPKGLDSKSEPFQQLRW